MKLVNELKYTEGKFSELLPKIKEHAAKLREVGGYKDFNTRLAFDCLYATVGSGTMCTWYDKYNCNDTHIKTLAVQALRNIAPELLDK
jgi:hypothetical protein